jgi:hypothetical protein
MKNEQKQFPSGFKSWIETYFNIVTHLQSTIACVDTMSFQALSKESDEGLYKLAEALTDEWEELHKETNWEGRNFKLELETFLVEKDAKIIS